MKFICKLTDISNIKRISFRQDINGLRAIAVLAVVFYHSELNLLIVKMFFYTDDNHLSIEGTSLLAERILYALEKD